MDAQAHLRLVETYRKKIFDYCETEYSANFDIFFLKEVYELFKFTSVSQFLRVVRHVSAVFLLNEFEMAAVRLNVGHLKNSRMSFQEVLFLDPELSALVEELKRQKEFKDRLCGLIMIALNAKVRSPAALQLPSVD